MIPYLLWKMPGVLWWTVRKSFVVLKAMTTLQMLFLFPTVGILLWLPTLFRPRDPQPLQEVQQTATEQQQPEAWNGSASGAPTHE